jgi:tRNA U34 5-methylaminomethyl-2-thiouridine-forming methyltransferase MnmC
MELQLLQTEDGSYSIFNATVNDTYHSRKGAVTESKYVFLKQGLDYLLQKYTDKTQINLLEVGFGTGLNTLLTAQYMTQSNHKNLLYDSLETAPISWEKLLQLQVEKWFLDKEMLPIFQMIHQTDWNVPVPISANFYLTKINLPLLNFLPTKQYDLIFYDAFAPNNQPDMWTEETFQHVFQLLAPQGFLVTYCAKGNVKRTLKACGFVVETLPGPPGKREMIRATK